MARILIVEDEAALAEALARGLSEERYTTEVCHDGTRAATIAMAGEHDLVILDLMLPGLDGLSLCRELRRWRVDVPILMLTARDATEDVVRGLDAGANDYLTKPFAFDELLARIRALLRRRSGARSSRISIADLTLDTAQRRVFRGDTEIALTSKEFQILEYLVLHRGRVLSKDALSDAAWSRRDFPGSNVIEVYIGNLRRKIDRGRDPRLIHTVRGAGYVLRPEE